MATSEQKPLTFNKKDVMPKPIERKDPAEDMNTFRWLLYRFSDKYPPYLHRLLLNADEKYNKFHIPRMATVSTVGKRDSFMRNALHIACMNNAPVNIIELLINVYPGAMNERDKSGRIPFHTACAHHRNIYALEYMIDVTENIMLEKTTFGVSAPTKFYLLFEFCFRVLPLTRRTFLFHFFRVHR